MRRKDALRRLNGLSPQVEEHLGKIRDNPSGPDVPHWVTEIENWIRQMEAVLPYVGDKTAAEWTARIEQWNNKRGNSMSATSAALQRLLGQVFDEMNEDLRDELASDEYDRRRGEFIFHMTDWKGDLDALKDLFDHPEGRDVDSTCTSLIGILCHVIPHLRAAARLLLKEEVPDPFLETVAASINATRAAAP